MIVLVLYVMISVCYYLLSWIYYNEDDDAAINWPKKRLQILRKNTNDNSIRMHIIFNILFSLLFLWHAVQVAQGTQPVMVGCPVSTCDSECIPEAIPLNPCETQQVIPLPVPFSSYLSHCNNNTLDFYSDSACTKLLYAVTNNACFYDNSTNSSDISLQCVGSSLPLTYAYSPDGACQTGLSTSPSANYSGASCTTVPTGSYLHLRAAAISVNCTSNVINWYYDNACQSPGPGTFNSSSCFVEGTGSNFIKCVQTTHNSPTTSPTSSLLRVKWFSFEFLLII